MRNLVIILLAILAQTVLAQKPIFVTSKVDQATVYFNSAELKHSAQVYLQKGSSEIVVKNVSDFVIEKTLRIGTPKNVSVLSTQFTKNYISEYEIDGTSLITQKVIDSINFVQLELAKNSNREKFNPKNHRITRQKPTSGWCKYRYKCNGIDQISRLLSIQKK